MTAKVSMALAVTAVMLLTTSSGKAANWKDALRDSLEAKYDLAKCSSLNMKITKAGTVLVAQKQNIVADLATDFFPALNKVHDSQVTQGWGEGMKKTSRGFKPGEKFYVYKINVKDREVEYFVVSCDPFEVNVEGSTREVRYKAILAFEFPKSFLETADADTVKKTVDAVLMPDAEVQAASTKTVELGQTPEQVEAALGKPQKVINLGTKKVYVYSDMKIVFVDGKVSDVQ